MYLVPVVTVIFPIFEFLRNQPLLYFKTKLMSNKIPFEIAALCRTSQKENFISIIIFTNILFRNIEKKGEIKKLFHE